MDSPPRVAYFCMEFGLSPELTLYSGGLGVLAGDFMKAAGDQRMPVVGIGLMWNEGYSAQQIDQSGYPEDHFVETRRDALVPVDVDVRVGVRGLQVRCRAYRVTRYTSAQLYLLEPRDARDK